jgi:hypothetical protein
MKMTILFFLTLQFLCCAAVFAWVDDSVAIKGTLESLNEKYIELKTTDQSIIQVPKHENDVIVYGRPIILKRKLAELTEVKTIKASPTYKKTEMDIPVRSLDYNEFDLRAKELLERLRQR